MTRETTLGGAVAALTIAAALLGPVRVAAAGDAPAAGGGIVPPSEYVEGIETPGKTGGTQSEAAAAKAQAAAPEPPAGSGQRVAAIAADVLIGRPTALIATVAGAAFYALSLPMTAPSGTSQEALERFVEEPGNRLIGPIAK